MAERRYLARDGQVGGIARVWVNPVVAFRAGKVDPRVAAARHRFPYIFPNQKALSVEQPVHVAEYDEEGWALVYRNNLDQFEDPPRFSYGCPLHHDEG
ncbi:hypothetical protein [Streptomyces sp. NPDC088182]|uniref:hypothetical protein n=1 Tax=Streptomyces sp. NPDC088182 TaxID=3365838 RepID=UPI003827C516